MKKLKKSIVILCQSILAALKILLEHLRTFASRAFGTLSWTKPEWIKLTHRGSGILAQRLRQIYAKDPKQAKIVLGSSLALALMTGLLWNWYKNLPKPHYVSISINPPGPQPLYENSKPFPLEISFSESAAPLTNVGKKVSEGVTLSPEQKGFWYWNNDRLLSFVPENDWPIDTKFLVKIGDRFLAAHVKIEDDELEFQSAAFVPRLAQSSFYVNPLNPKEKRGSFELAFSHPIDLQSLNDHVEITLEKKNAGIFGTSKRNLKFTASQDPLGGKATVISEDVGIPADDSIMRLKVNKGLRSYRGGNGSSIELNSEISVPGMYNFFRIQEVTPTLVRNDKFEPEQILVIQTTADAKSDVIGAGLEVFLLPKDKPAEGSQELKKNYDWSSEAELSAKTESLLVRVPLETIPSENEATQMHSFKFKADTGRYLLVKIKKGLRSYGDYVLSNDYRGVVRVPPFPRELLIMHSGSILSMSGDQKLSILSSNVDHIRYSVGRVLPSEIAHLVTQSYGDFKKPHFDTYRFGIDNLSERFEEIKNVIVTDRGKTNYTAIDLSRYLAQEGASKKGIFYLNVESWDPKTKTSTGLADQRLLLVTDLGILAKQNSNRSWTLFIQSLASGSPLGAATVEVIGKNGLSLLSRATLDDGRVEIPDLSDFKNEKEAVAFVVKRGGDLSYLPVRKNHDRSMNYSRFDVGGAYVTPSEDRLSALVFSDRGIYRPGDEIRGAYIVKASSWSNSVNGVPIEITLQDPKGNEVHKEKRSLNSLGFDDILYQSHPGSLTGTYRLNVFLIKNKNRDVLLGSTTLKVEEFLPDRLKISSRLSKESTEGWVTPDDLKARVNLKNLFGTPAQRRRISASIRLSPVIPSFKKYSDYRFSLAKDQSKVIEERLEDQQSDDEGNVEFDLALNRFEKATYRLFFSAEGFENEGGRGVHADSSVLVSPRSYLVGYKPDGDLTYIAKDTERNLHWIAIDPNLKSVKSEELKLQLVEIKWISVLSRQYNGLYKYQSVLKESVIQEKPFSVSEKGNLTRLPTDRPGDFAYILRDNENNPLNRVDFMVAGKANLSRGLDRSAELQVALDRKDYDAGSEISVSIKAPYTGSGLITIERDKVYAHKWFSTETTSTVQNIRIPEGLEGNAYVNVSFVRALNSEEIFISPLSYGVLPFSISRAGRTNSLTLQVPERSKPGEALKIRYRAQKTGVAEKEYAAMLTAVPDSIEKQRSHGLKLKFDAIYRGVDPRNGENFYSSESYTERIYGSCNLVYEV